MTPDQTIAQLEATLAKERDIAEINGRNHSYFVQRYWNLLDEVREMRRDELLIAAREVLR